jgi:hypothetical protein
VLTLPQLLPKLVLLSAIRTVAAVQIPAAARLLLLPPHRHRSCVKDAGMLLLLAQPAAAALPLRVLPLLLRDATIQGDLLEAC